MLFLIGRSSFDFQHWPYHIYPFTNNKGAEEGGASVVAEGNNNGEVEDKSLGKKTLRNVTADNTNPTRQINLKTYS